MLHTRIKLLKSYLTSLPPSYLTAPSDGSDHASETSPANEKLSTPDIDYPLLRSTQALLSRLPLLLPSGSLSNFKQQSLAEKSDVELTSLLGIVGQSVKDASELGRKFAVMEANRNLSRKLDIGFGGPRDLGFEESESTGGPLGEDFLE